MRTGMMLVSLAGPLMNILLAVIGVLLLKYLPLVMTGDNLYMFARLLETLVWINVILAAFNLIPVPPLDGSKILAGLLPPRGAEFFDRLEPYGTIILLLLIVTGAVGTVLYPLIYAIMGVLRLVI